MWMDASCMSLLQILCNWINCSSNNENKKKLYEHVNTEHNNTDNTHFKSMCMSPALIKVNTCIFGCNVANSSSLHI